MSNSHRGGRNAQLHGAKKAKDDEFYTEYVDIENELSHYTDHFRGRTVLCNCDDPRISNFFRYFANNFDYLGLRRVIATCYRNCQPDLFSSMSDEHAVYLVYDGNGGKPTPDFSKADVLPLEGDGDFRSPECVRLLDEADIVVTNPPFSLFREFIGLLEQHEKKFLVLGNQNAITYKEIFPLIKSNRLWLGYKSGDMSFRVPADSEPRKTRFWVDGTGQKWRSMGNICWFTNLDIRKRHEELLLWRKYRPEDYPKYDNYDAINVDKVADIPVDYDGVMGVPITFLDKYNPDQFEIVEFRKGRDGKDLVYSTRGGADTALFQDSRPATSIPGMIKNAEGSIGGGAGRTYARILIRRLPSPVF